MKGWTKLYRELLDKPIWLNSSPEQKTILITLLLMANHEQKEWEWQGKKYVVNPGQFITSLDSIVKKCGCGVSIMNVRTALKRFENYEFLTSESTNKNRLITIVNWRTYQDKEEQTNKAANKQLTSSQQAANKQLTTNKNDKNDKNDKNNYYYYKEKFQQEKFSDIFQQCGGSCSKYNFNKLKDLEKEYGAELLIKAIEIAAENNKLTIAYIKGILNNWNKKEVVDGYEDLKIIKL